MAPRMAPRKRKPQMSRGKGRSSNGPPEISQIVSEQLAAAMPSIISQLGASINQNLGRSGNGGTGAGGSGAGGSATIITEDDRRGCSYKAFMGCKPIDFKGTEGAVGVIRWMEKTESVLKVSGCAENNKVTYAACTFQGKALTWWNTEVRTRGRENIDAMTWEQFKEILHAEYCPRNEIQKIEAELWELAMKGADIQGYTNRFYELSQIVPHMVTPEQRGMDRYIWGLVPQIRANVIASRPTTMQSAISIANIMTDEMTRNGTLNKVESQEESGNKRRKFDNRGNSGKRANSGYGKNRQAAQNFAAVVPDKKSKDGGRPKCDKCNYNHHGACRFCANCKKKGHTENYCKFSMVPRGSCFECGSPDHFRNACPKLSRNTGNAPNAPRGRAFV